MFIKTTFDQKFLDLWMYLQTKYPDELFNIDGVGKQTDMTVFSQDFFSNKSSTSDISIDDNSNVDDKSVIAYTTELPKAFFKLNSYYVLWKKIKQLYTHQLANDIIEKQITGTIYINDLHGVGAGMPYCFNYSTLDVATKGLPMVKKIKSLPPKHFSSFRSQLEQFITLASNSSLGATGIADFLLTSSIYVNKMLKSKKDSSFEFKTDNDIWNYVEESLIALIYTLNQPMRGNQSPFTNISIYDDNFLDVLLPSYILVIKDEVFEATKETVKKLQEIFILVMNKELERTPITFPVVTACFSIDDDKNIKDERFLEFISRENIKYGFINIYSGKESTLSSCCRLRSDIIEDIGYQNSIGGSGSKIGSLGVATINLPKLGVVSKNESEFFNRLDELVHNCQSVNNAKRKIVQKRIDNHHAPMYNYGFMDITRQYSTCGLVGLNECVAEMGYDILESNGQEFAIKIMNVINSINKKLDSKYKCLHNCEQIPAESAAVKLAQKDRLLKFNDKYEFYSNQFIPLVSKADLLDRIYLQGKFDSHFSGGSIAHINVETRIEDPVVLQNLIKTCASNGVIYFAINYAINICENYHTSVGDLKKCPVCGGEITDVFTRVVGFLTNVRDWNKTRRELDFTNRQFYGNL